jgi:anti-sigma factor RsiW
MPTCADVQRNLSRYVDDDLPPDEQAAVTQHLASCETCRGMDADLRQIRARARTLGPVPPPGHLWSQITDRLQREDVDAQAPTLNHVRSSTFDVRSWPMSMSWSRRSRLWLGLAAALVVALGTYIAAWVSRRAPATAPADNASRVVSVQDVAEELDQALAHYDRAVAGLETLAREDGASMDPAVRAALQTNLTAIDRAIAESRAALVANPQNASARASLADALRQKVDVLQTTVAVVDDLRRDNQDDAAGAAKTQGKQS